MSNRHFSLYIRALIEIKVTGSQLKMKIAIYLPFVVVALLPHHFVAQPCVRSSREAYLNFPDGGPSCRVKLNKLQHYCRNNGTNCRSHHTPLTYRLNSWLLKVRHCQPSDTSLITGLISTADIRANKGCSNYHGKNDVRYSFVDHLQCSCEEVLEQLSDGICPYSNCQSYIDGK